MQSNNRSRSCHGKSEMLVEDICPSHNTSHVNNNKGKTEKDLTMSCSNIQVSPKPFSMTGTNLFIPEDTWIICYLLDSQIKRTSTLRKFQAKRGMKNTFQVVDSWQATNILNNLGPCLQLFGETYWMGLFCLSLLCVWYSNALIWNYVFNCLS